MNKEDLRKRNRELRHKIVLRARQQKVKALKKAGQDNLKKAEKLKDPKYSYPEVILTILKRLKRIDPNRTVAGMDPHQAALISFFKLKQSGFKELRIGSNSIHAWVEFEYDKKWWIFDPVAVKDRSLGLPVKKKSDTEEIQYSTLSRYYSNVDDYIETWNNSIDYTKDECKIAAMDDPGLQQALNISYH